MTSNYLNNRIEDGQTPVKLSRIEQAIKDTRDEILTSLMASGLSLSQVKKIMDQIDHLTGLCGCRACGCDACGVAEDCGIG